LLIVIIF